MRLPSVPLTLRPLGLRAAPVGAPCRGSLLRRPAPPGLRRHGALPSAAWKTRGPPEREPPPPPGRALRRPRPWGAGRAAALAKRRLGLRPGVRRAGRAAGCHTHGPCCTRERVLQRAGPSGPRRYRAAQPRARASAASPSSGFGQGASPSCSAVTPSLAPLRRAALREPRRPQAR